MGGTGARSRQPGLWTRLCRTLHRYDAKDITQEVFIRVFRNIASCRSGNLDAWLHRITVYAVLDRARRNGHLRLEPLSDETVIERHCAGQHNADPMPLSRSSVMTFVRRWRCSTRTCGPLCRFDVDGLTYEEFAAALGE